MTLYIDTRPTLGEWIEKPNDITYHRRYCDTVFGRYTIAILGDKYELLLHGFVTYSFDPYDTFDQAKAAAQADYDRRTAERFRRVELVTTPCPECSGHGYSDEHDPDDPHEFGCCTNCPIQVPCECCHATGELTIVYNEAIAKAKEQP